MKKYTVWTMALLCLSIFGCEKPISTAEQSATELNPPFAKRELSTNPQNASFDEDFAVGVDLSSVPKDIVNKGAIYYDKAGNPTECHALFKSLGANAVRIRVWVNHTAGYSNKNSVVAQAILAHNLGMKIMIDFHYSDTWADKDNQKKPVAWAAYTLTQLKDAVYDHTFDVMDSLKYHGIYPEWVQVGNETNKGMLLTTGDASANMPNYAALVNKGYDAVKAVSPQSKVIIHLAGGDQLSYFQWFFDGLKNNGGKFDVVGMSLYPPSSTTWQATNNTGFVNMKTLATRYNKEVMICEIGMNWTDSIQCRAYVADIINKTRHVPNGKGLGVFYWAPESYSPITAYPNGMMNALGRPSFSTEAFQDSVNNNYALNPDFDEQGATHNPVPWYCNNGSSSTNGAYTETGGYNGIYRLTHWKNVNYTVKSYQVASNIPNGNYTLRAWVKSSGGQDTCQLIAKEYAAVGVQKTANIPLTGTWKQIQISNIAVVNNTCKIVLHSKSPANKWCSIDGVQLLKQ